MTLHTRLGEALPAGLTHPYEASVPQANCYRHGYTFTWTRGDAYVAVQRGRVANCERVRMLVVDPLGDDLLLGRRPVVDWLPAPVGGLPEWRKPGVIGDVADLWREIKRAEMRRTS